MKETLALHYIEKTKIQLECSTRFWHSDTISFQLQSCILTFGFFVWTIDNLWRYCKILFFKLARFMGCYWISIPAPPTCRLSPFCFAKAIEVFVSYCANLEFQLQPNNWKYSWNSVTEIIFDHVSTKISCSHFVCWNSSSTVMGNSLNKKKHPEFCLQMQKFNFI